MTDQLVCATFPIQTMTGAEISELESNASELTVTPGGYFEEKQITYCLTFCPSSFLVSRMVATCPPVLTSCLFDHSRNKILHFSHPSNNAKTLRSVLNWQEMAKLAFLFGCV